MTENDKRGILIPEIRCKEHSFVLVEKNDDGEIINSLVIHPDELCEFSHKTDDGYKLKTIRSRVKTYITPSCNFYLKFTPKTTARDRILADFYGFPERKEILNPCPIKVASGNLYLTTETTIEKVLQNREEFFEKIHDEIQEEKESSKLEFEIINPIKIEEETSEVFSFAYIGKTA